MTNRTSLVAEFPTSYSGGKDRFEYPGPRPTESYLTDGETIRFFEGSLETTLEQMEAELKALEVPGFDERVLVVSYGSNLNPAALRHKFQRYGSEDVQRELQVVPQIYIDLEQHDVVWHGRPGQKGSYFAELYKGIETEKSSVRVGLSALTDEQLLVMHTTEGITYGVTQIASLDVNGTRKPIFAYAAREASILIDETGSPIAVAGVERADSDLPVITAREAVEMTLNIPAVREKLGDVTPEQFYDASSSLSLADKKQRQAMVQNAMGEHTVPYAYPAEGKEQLGRAAFSATMKDAHALELIRMPEMVAQQLRPTREEIERYVTEAMANDPRLDAEIVRKTARAKLDPVEIIRDRATNELASRLKKI